MNKKWQKTALGVGKGGFFVHIWGMKLTQILAEKEAQIADLRQRNAQLQDELDWLKRQVFGQKRERFIPENPEQLLLGLGLETPAETEPEKEKITYERTKKQKPTGRQPWPSHLPVVEIMVMPDCDISGMKQIGEDRTEELEYIPGSLFRRVFIRPRFVNEQADEEHGGKTIILASMPSRPLPKLSAGPGLLTSIICDKFMDHLPLYRQLKRFLRLGVRIPASTLSGWVLSVAELLEPLYLALKKEMLQSGYVQADETTIKVLDELHNVSKKKKLKAPGKTHRGYFWAYYAPRKQLALFEYQPGRDARGPTEMLGDYRGALQTDGYSVYEAFDKKKDITLIGCLAHVRRKFYEARQNDQQRAQEALAFIGQLYQVEQAAREKKLTPEERLKRRIETAKPIWDKWQTWLAEQQTSGKVLPNSAIGKAITYACNRNKYIARYLQDGQLEIDNNLVENQIRPIALGRKNYLFAGSERAAQCAAILYSLLASCKQNDIDPYTWLRDVLESIAEHPINRIDELLPHKWKPNPNIPEVFRQTP